ncbi:MAG: HAD hydrolase family protein [Methylacidiphilales bacterium]|nr:HAD hydrolase family protein [Candidatus Methylacidiphilales bacterium]
MTQLHKKTALLSSSLRMICTDYDGTITEPEHQPISFSFFERLAAWRRHGPVYWVINTGRTYENLRDDLIARKVPIWPDWIVALEREIWLVRDRRGVGWFEWNRRCELLHAQLFESVQPLWKLIEDYIIHHTQAQLVEDAGSPLGIIASCTEEADEISAYMTPLLEDWPTLTAVRNSIYFRFSHKFYHKGACLEAISSGLNVQPLQILAVGDHMNDLPMLDRRYARHLACPGNAVGEVKERVRSQGGYVAKASVAEGTVEAWDKLFPLPSQH